jgi:hypothetical protein
MLYMDRIALEHSYILEWICQSDNRNDNSWDTPHAGADHGWRFAVAQSMDDSNALAPDSGLVLFP